MYFIYRILNLVNNKIYIGKTTNTIKQRWSRHASDAKYCKKLKKESIIHLAINKYGKQNFDIKVIDQTLDLNKLRFLEVFYILYYNTLDKRYGYNILLGDKYEDGRIDYSEGEKEKISLNGVLNTRKPNGVFFCNSDCRWHLKIKREGEIFTKSFKNETEAKETKDKLGLLIYGEGFFSLYYPNNLEDYKKENLEELFCRTFVKKQKQSQYKGVSLTKDGSFYFTRVIYMKKSVYLGFYPSEEEAAIVFDKVFYYLFNDRKKLNFPNQISSDYKEEGQKLFNYWISESRRPQRTKKKLSSYNGVSKRSRGTWHMIFTLNYKIVRGSFTNELDAALAYDFYIRKYNGNYKHLNFPEITDTPQPKNYNTLNDGIKS